MLNLIVGKKTMVAAVGKTIRLPKCKWNKTKSLNV